MGLGQENFSDTMIRLGSFVACPRSFGLSTPVEDPEKIAVVVDGIVLPRFTCSHSGGIERCGGLNDNSCSHGSCVGSWTYEPPEVPPQPDAIGGTISFADHLDPCDSDKETVKIEFYEVSE